MSSAKSSIYFDNKASSIKVDDKKPTFTVYIDKNSSDCYIFSDPENIYYLKLVKLHVKGNRRHLRTGKYGLAAGVERGLMEEDIVPLDIQKNNDTTYILSPKEPINKGEYGFYYIGGGGVPEGITEINGVFEFTVTKK